MPQMPHEGVPRGHMNDRCREVRPNLAMSGVSCRDARIGFLSMRPVLVRHPASSKATFSEAAASAIGYFRLPACYMTACDALSSSPYSRTRLPAWSLIAVSHTLSEAKISSLEVEAWPLPDCLALTACF